MTGVWVRRGPFVAALVVALALLAGCDFGEDEATILVEEELVFRFAFDSDTVSVDAPLTVLSSNAQSFEPGLSDKALTLDQVSGARLKSASVEVLFPLDGLISMTDRASVRLVAPGSTPLEVAAVENLTGASDDTAALTPIAGLSLRDIAQAGAFRAELGLKPNATMESEESYEIGVALVFEIEVRLQ